MRRKPSVRQLYNVPVGDFIQIYKEGGKIQGVKVFSGDDGTDAYDEILDFSDMKVRYFATSVYATEYIPTKEEHFRAIAFTV